MVTIQERFMRAFNVLMKFQKENEFVMSEQPKDNDLNLTWLRNEAKLWEDYEEDMTCIVGGVNYDPNHPDNLSASVWNAFRIHNNFFN